MDRIDRADARYPPLLREIHDSPAELYCRGKLEAGSLYVAIVGTRRLTRYGETTAFNLAADLARRGAWVVSGMARGIDSAAHRGALSVKGKTVAVFGTSLDHIYPSENRGLADSIAASGALVSEFARGVPPEKYVFVRRNRIIAGMCPITVVVESDVGGGSMITADFACEEGRSVFAVPGRIDQRTSAGCNQLIRDGAGLATCADDILSELGLAWGATKKRRSSARPPATEEEAKVLECFRGGAQCSFDELAQRSALEAPKVSAILIALELGGRISKRRDGMYEAI